jgi:hypothetical protein
VSVSIPVRFFACLTGAGLTLPAIAIALGLRQAGASGDRHDGLGPRLPASRKKHST